jgi:hypothetical protein
VASFWRQQRPLVKAKIRHVFIIILCQVHLIWRLLRKLKTTCTHSTTDSLRTVSCSRFLRLLWLRLATRVDVKNILINRSNYKSRWRITNIYKKYKNREVGEKNRTKKIIFICHFC